MEIVLSALSQGAIWTLMGIGVYITFRILNEADLTTEASFTLGAAIGAQLLVLGMNPLLSMAVAFLMGAAAGAVTALLITKLKINSLLAGIITLTGLYSINLAFMGSANLSLSGATTLKTQMGVFGLPRNVDTLILGVVMILIAVAALSYFFRTDMGQALIATGDNPFMAKSLGIPTGEMMLLGYMLGNGLIALSGYLVATDSGYADISMGIGSIVIGLAAIIIGEVVVRNVSLPVRLLAIFVGSVIYRLLLALVLQLKINTDNFKLLSAVILALCLSIPALQKFFAGKRAAGLPASAVPATPGARVAPVAGGASVAAGAAERAADTGVGEDGSEGAR
ncbi:putative ABC transport system permease protein [Arcanobacterium wilhelmae]|uniref:ABC transport system permease protein n=1 Tax=Arcanobacterium wilhelmae TaxID=1803177 RepID=A0ABT9NCT6_9ACTO|nr:ABC transporter permease [Arcanobacterium wilhelmae]MDP9801006.1 putative ABC transport system permease protein [Arcanobacterium wilhelmae]WFN90366.1 ABC transporter permease [Arcanobacterium wilhelmae]